MPDIEFGEIDNPDWIQREDANGNVILEEQNTGQTFTLQPDGTFDSPAVTTGEVMIGGGDVFKRVGRKTPSSDTSQIQFTGLSDDREYRLFYDTFVEGETSLIVRLNGDGAGTGNYHYWDSSSTQQTAQDEMLLIDQSLSSSLGGSLTIIDSRFGTDNRDAFHHRPLMAGPADRISNFSREGGRDVTDGLSSIEMISTGSNGMEGSRTVVELWERDYS